MSLLSRFEEKLELEKVIYSTRKEMIKIGMQEGLNNEKTIMISQKLDKYIAEYQTLYNL